MLAIAESMTETSEYSPLISRLTRRIVDVVIKNKISFFSDLYLIAVMAITSVSVMMAVFVLNLRYRGPTKNEIPFWFQPVIKFIVS